ncbi:hypothetical protein SEA_MARSHAWN_51 [Mycobacterium phage Marshawn]|uniref:Uncharacterized protein n=1 Tax=Mycobacterium phage Marshawn TaxID=2652423 RepID=A0A5P8D735_9CAUD|nr:hypothetical protein I5H02_gp48 [Mycobacterium phage Marshawn]QFP94837.1 hypothetical protein SEA_MARSHAWN_51 [Mycobacterium phage Marshawn]
MSDRLITLTHDELRAAAAVLDAHKAAGTTTIGALAWAIRAVNVARTPAPAADCTDCQRHDGTCPGHLPRAVRQ